MTEPQGTRTLVVSKSSHEKVIKEIADSQTRVVQTLVPTILAIGLIAVAASASLGGSEGASRFRLDIVVGCTFAILFSSSIYVAALSYKIFRNGTFLSVFAPTETGKDEVEWETVVGRYNLHNPAANLL